MPDFGAPVLFHYTRPDHAEAIFDERTYLVSSRRDPEFGTGFWVTDIAPDAMGDQELRTTLFPERPVAYVHGVVVLVRRSEFGRVRDHEFLWPLEPGATVDLREIALAVGRLTSTGWTFRRDPRG